MTPAAYISIASLIISIITLINSVRWRRVTARLDALSIAQGLNAKLRQESHEVTVFNNSSQLLTVKAVMLGDALLPPTNVDVLPASDAAWNIPEAARDYSGRKTITLTYDDGHGRAWERIGRAQPRRID